MALPRPDNQRRRRTVERPSEAATGSSRRIVNRVRRDPAGSPVKERVADIGAGPGEAGWNPVDAHTRRTSCRSPFDPIEGDAPRRGDLLLPSGRAGTPVASEANLTETGRNPAKPDMSVSGREHQEPWEMLKRRGRLPTGLLQQSPVLQPADDPPSSAQTIQPPTVLDALSAGHRCTRLLASATALPLGHFRTTFADVPMLSDTIDTLIANKIGRTTRLNS